MGYGLNKFNEAVQEAVGEELREEFASIQGHTEVAKDTKTLVIVMLQLLKQQKKTNELLSRLTEVKDKSYTFTNAVAKDFKPLTATVGIGNPSLTAVSAKKVVVE